MTPTATEEAAACATPVLVLDRTDRLEQLRQAWPELAERVEGAATLAERSERS